MATLSKMIILWWLFTLWQFLFDFIVPNIMMKQKGKGYQGIGAIDEAFEYKNTGRYFKSCNYWEKWKTICQTTAVSIYEGPKGHFQIKILLMTNVDGFTDELMWCSSCKGFKSKGLAFRIKNKCYFVKNVEFSISKIQNHFFSKILHFLVVTLCLYLWLSV